MSDLPAGAGGALVPAPAAIALAAAAYLLGAVPFALLLGKWRGVDIRSVGSGNIGATNLARALGKPWGVAAFGLDFAKGLVPVLAVGWASDLGGSRPALAVLAEHARIACALAAVLGHVFPVYLRCRGGKGVATGFGALAGLAWPAALAAGAVWLVLYGLTRTVSIASLAAALVFPAATIALFWRAPVEIAVPMDLVAAAVGVLIVIRHRSNIRRLLHGEEGRV